MTSEEIVTENVGAAGDFETVPNSSSTSNSRKRPFLEIFSYLKSELTRGYMLERDEFKYAERRERVYTFMKTPRELEKFCTYGFFLCLDAFLFIFTLMPVRILIAIVRLFTHPCGLFSSSSRRYLESAHICDLLKGIILFVVCLILDHIDTSMMYHLVRGQSVIKLYVFYNMLDVCDRLFSGFGQDILDSLFWTATEPRGKKREHVGVVPHLLLAIVYVIIHTLLILSQATVLNVAFNSHNKSLLTIMMSNNFVEIKGSLFKRVDKNNLFQISCSDVKERFHYAILLSVVFVRNMAEFSWNLDHIWVIVPDVILVLGAEFIVDWIKHAFITKFNEISSDAYQDFTVNLIQDMASSRQKHAFTDLGDQVSRRMGFTPIPLACLLIRIVSKSIKISGYLGLAVMVLLYLCLLTFKMINSIILLGHGSRVLARHRQKSGKTKPLEINSQVIPKKFEKNTAPKTDQDSTSETRKPTSSSQVVTDTGLVTSSLVTTSASSQTVITRTSPSHVVNSYWEAETTDAMSETPSGWSVCSPSGHVTISQCSSSSSLECFAHGSEINKSGTQTPDSEYFESTSQDLPPTVVSAVDKDKKVK
ncbi:transmembrane anterior posterior transformation protein 1 homolog isoform X2 [Gigantopelta aegis]|uniref:transmembrane anterior posterior transformation protein 1 homolog isoform X2 n=1 Tax=Gigantopelta aegis TaxID=1735272 RepID=UPI001B887B4F|nr:transmembrane anterior posterior transformation protein 1 homolog isoform X2 [Gigantopelta aegis]